MNKTRHCLIVIFVFYNNCFCNVVVNKFVNDSSKQVDEFNKCVVGLLGEIQDSEVIDVTLVNVDDDLASILHKRQDIRIITRKFFWISNTAYNQIYIIRVNNIENFKIRFNLMKMDTYWNPKAKFIITFESSYPDLEDISNMLLENNVFNVLVVGKINSEEYLVYSFGTKLDSCVQPIYKILKYLYPCSDIRNISFTSQIELERKKLDGCHIKFVTHDYFPFINIKNLTNSFPGLEQYMIWLWKYSQNVTVEFIDYGPTEQFGYVLSNYSYTGMLGHIQNNYVDGAIGGYVVLLNRINGLDFVYPFLIDHLKIILPKPRVLSRWETVFRELNILTISVILINFIIFALASIKLYIFKSQNNDKIRDILITLGYFLNNVTYQNINNGAPQRIILISMLFLVFIITCTIQASLSSAITHPVNDYIITDPEEALSRCKLIISRGVLGYLTGTSTTTSIELIRKYCDETLECMKIVTDNTADEYCTLVSEVYHDHYTWKFVDEDGTRQIYQIQEPLATIFQTIYFKKGSSYMNSFNGVIGRAVTGGFLDQYAKLLVINEHFLYQIHDISDKEDQFLREFIEVFIILIIGYSLSFVIFIFEYKSRNKETFIKMYEPQNL